MADETTTEKKPRKWRIPVRVVGDQDGSNAVLAGFNRTKSRENPPFWATSEFFKGRLTPDS